MTDRVKTDYQHTSAPTIEIDTTVKDATLDRHERARENGRKGGLATVEKYGREHMSRIGKAGFAATCKSHYSGVSGYAVAGIFYGRKKRDIKPPRHYI